MPSAILALDQGTTGSRAILFSRQGVVLASAYQAFPQYFPKPGWVEHDPEEIWSSVRRAIQRVLRQAPQVTIHAIGITNQRETTLLWDRQTGRPVSRAIVWQCRRTAERCDRLRKQKGAEAWFRRRTGLPLDAYFSATKVEWLLKHVPAARRLAKQNQLCFGTTDTWVLWKLTGGQTHATDFTNASRTLLFNIHTRSWDQAILKKFKIPRSLLPEVKPSSGIFGHTIRLGRLPAGLPIAGMAGDQQAALFGQTCFTPGSMKNTYGTGCFVLMNTGKRPVRSARGLITTLGCNARGEPCYVLEGAIFVAGAAIQWLRDELKILTHAADSARLASSLSSNQGVYLVPAFVGLGAPYWDSEARGVLVGLTRGTNRAHLARAALEAMAYSTQDVLRVMQKESRLRLPALKIDGGATANDFLCQFQADLLGVPVIRPKILESTALGAAFLAGLAVGFWRNGQEIKKLWQRDRVFRPRASRRQARAWTQGWLQAVARARLRSA